MVLRRCTLIRGLEGSHRGKRVRDLEAEEELEHRSDGSVVVRTGVVGTIEASRWVLAWGGAVEALAPPELRDRVRDELTRALAYGIGARKRTESHQIERPGSRMSRADSPAPIDVKGAE